MSNFSAIINRQTAAKYDAAHLGGAEHMIALSVFSGLIVEFNPSSILDAGAGTGRGVAFLQKRFPTCRVVGIEPVAELREQGYAKGISKSSLIEGCACSPLFRRGVRLGYCAFITYDKFKKATSEICRVARYGVVLSDSNNMGQGCSLMRVRKASKGVWALASVYFLPNTPTPASLTRLSCRLFAANAVRLQLHALAYNFGNFLRTLATPEPIKDWC